MTTAIKKPENIVIRRADGIFIVWHKGVQYDAIHADTNRTLFYEGDDLFFHVPGHIPPEHIMAVLMAFDAGWTDGDASGRRQLQVDFASVMGIKS